MCEPRTDWTDPLVGASIEIIAASSALCMPPEPLRSRVPNPEDTFLCDTDEWANHARAHLRAAHALLARVRQ